ncbi:MAG: hypothetical protein IJY65_02780 [Clostridia bacterium]|nr:hypothetical protein [Clostridia bacterium]
MKKSLKILSFLLLVGTLLSILVIAPSASGAVARIGEVEYSSLDEAWADVNVTGNDPVTLTILSDLTVTEVYRVTAKGADITVDLNYHTLTANENKSIFTVDADAKLTLKNGNLTSTYTVIETCAPGADLALENIVVKKPSDNTTTAINLGGSGRVDIKDSAVYATRCITVAKNGIVMNAEGLISSAGTSNALRVPGSVFFGEFNFTECIFTSTGGGRPIEVAVSSTTATPEELGGIGSAFESALVSQSGTVSTYEVTENKAGTFNLYNCSVINYPNTSAASMLIKPGVFKWNLYGGFYSTTSSKYLFNNTYAGGQAYCLMELFAYEGEGGVIYPSFTVNPTNADQASRVYLSNFYTPKATYTYDSATGAYSTFTVTATEREDKSSVVTLESGTYKYVLVPYGKTYSEFSAPTDPKDAVARIGSTFYESFEAANAAAKPTDIIVLTADVTGAVATNRCLLNTSGYSITFSESSPLSCFDISTDFKAVDKAVDLTVRYWSSVAAYEVYKTSGDTSGLGWSMEKSIAEGAGADFSRGYCTLDLSYYSGDDYYLHTGWELAAGGDTEIDYIPTFSLQADLFAVYRSDGSLLKVGKTPLEFQAEMLKPTESGEVIKLLGDIALPKINQAINAAYKPYTLDINGYTLSVGDGAGSGAMYKTYKNINLTITSSRKGGVINNMYKSGGSAQMFWCAGGSSGKVTINGENLTVYTGTLLYCTASERVTYEINGGTYIMRRATSSGFIVLTGTGECNLTVNNATLISPYHNLLALGRSSEPLGEVSVSFNRSTVIADSKPILNTTAGAYFDASVSFTECNLALSYNSQAGIDVTVGEGCALTTPYASGVTLTNDFTEIDPICYEDYEFSYSTSEKSALARVEWNMDGNIKTVYAEPRDTELKLSESTVKDFVKTTYSASRTVALEAGKVYRFDTSKERSVAVEGIKYNLTLASNMDVNIAIPAEAYRHVSATYLGKALVGEYKIIGTGEYYVVSVSDMNAVSTLNDITVRLNIDGAKSQKVSVSIANYARLLMECGNGGVERELGRGILQYSLEAYRALLPGDTESVELLEEMLKEFEAPESAVFERGDTTSLAKYFEGARLRLDSTPGIVFTLSDSLDALECDISYTDANGNVISEHFSLASNNREAVIEGIKVYEFDSDITLMVESEDPMTYNLETYLASGSVEDGFAQAIHNYVEATKAYMETVRHSASITSLTLKGEDVTGTVIIADPSDTLICEAASILRSAIYTYSGILLEIEGTESSAQRKILISLVSDAGEDNFRARVVGDNLLLECEYSDYLKKGVEMFVNDTLLETEGELDFGEGYLYEGDARYVRYSEFGAVCDGFTNDLPAIIATHAYANDRGMRVEADVGAIYYIGFVAEEAIVKTDTNWRNARFFIDDRNVTLAEKNYWIFRVSSDTPVYNIPVPSGMAPKIGDTNIGLTFDKAVMLTITNSGEKVYIRYGNNANDGNDKHEVLLVDRDGNIDESTPLIFDYKAVTKISVHAVDDKPITVEGGDFTTYANRQYSTESNYFNRGIMIERSNTTVYNVIHRIEKEPASANALRPYMGFFNASNTYNVTIDSCAVTGHFGSGTYDIVSNNSSHVTWKRCTQLNDINDRTYWGVMASNYSKNLTWEDCVMSRFDAHCGVHNVVIRNCEIGEVINLVGSGTALIENTKRSGKANSYFIRLREDYGSTWNGKIIIKDCTFSVGNSVTEAYAIRADWNEHWFGYDCYLPDLEIDGLTVTKVNGNAFDGKIYIFKNPKSTYSGDLRENSVNPLYAPSSVSLKGVEYDDVLQGTNNDIIFTETVIKEED